jgi:hypothetical protein
MRADRQRVQAARDPPRMCRRHLPGCAAAFLRRTALPLGCAALPLSCHRPALPRLLRRPVVSVRRPHGRVQDCLPASLCRKGQAAHPEGNLGQP